MTQTQFRSLALSLPEASEGAHMDHPDFRVGGKIFATLAPERGWGMVKLTPEQQAIFLKTDADGFEPASGAWGKRGATMVHLKKVDEATVREALRLAWRNTAPKRLARRHEEG
ncbi:MAG: MmcQ/YjbR family DNA-binding protein [Gemmataceae bacterium]